LARLDGYKIRNRVGAGLAGLAGRIAPGATGRMFPVETRIPRPDPKKFRVGPVANFEHVALTTVGRMNTAGLRWDHDVLDIGCGVGRIARYLCDYLVRGRYEGFDIRQDLVTWCQVHITSQCPQFQFTYVPAFNTHYARDESLPSAEDLVFPYPDSSFDFVFAQSVFTHLTPAIAQNYLHQTRRVLRPGGTTFLTWLIFEDHDTTDYDHPAMPRMHRDSSGKFAVAREARPESAIAYREDFVRDMYRESGLQIIEPIRCGFALFQDAVIATK
jgi:SAM-dependent methyltransferase